MPFRRAHFFVELQLKLEFSSVCGYRGRRSGAARSEGTAAPNRQSQEGDQRLIDNYDFPTPKFNRPQPVRRILRLQTGRGYGPAPAS
jgi:hypothetical protein